MQAALGRGGQCEGQLAQGRWGEMGSRQPLHARRGTGILRPLWARPQFPAGQPGRFQAEAEALAKAGVGVAVCTSRGSGQGGICVVPEAHLVPTSQSPMVQCPGQWLFRPGASSQMGAHRAAGGRRIPRGARPCTDLRSQLSSCGVSIRAPPCPHQYPCPDTLLSGP